MDVALIDGDHNWYTVFTELSLLADVARQADALMPVVILHDVAWPYGRRDLYYDPSNIPEEHRQPWAREGMRRGKPELLPRGGLNSNLANAVLEGGPRNGVMTAIEDFIAAHDKSVRLVVLPIFFGLAIVVEEARLAVQPSLAAALERLESSEGKDMLLGLSEDIRLDSLMLDQALLTRKRQPQQRSDRPLPRDHQADRPSTTLHVDVRDAVPARARLDHLHECLDKTWNGFVPGDMAVIGVGSGASAAFIAAYLEAHDLETRPQLQRKLWIADPVGTNGDSTDLEATKQLLHRLDLLSERIRFLPGGAEGTAPHAPSGPLMLIHVGPDAGADARTALERLNPRLAAGGMVVRDDAHHKILS